MRVIAEADGGYYMITDYPDPERAFLDRGVKAYVVNVERREISAPMHPVSITKSGGWRKAVEQPRDLQLWLQDFDWQEYPPRRLTDLPRVA